MAILIPRPGISDIAPYKGGGYVAEGANIWGLASNENLLGPSPKAKKAFQESLKRIHRYPEQSGLRLKTSIGALHDIDPDRILLGNGSDEILSLLFRAYLEDGDEVILSENGFFLFPILAKSQNAKIVVAEEKNLTTQVDALLAAISPKTKIICVANPNNPTGTYVPETELKRLCENVPSNVLIIIDSAYAEYVVEADYGTGQKFVELYPNVVMTRTFSKIYALAGLRVGWAYASLEVVDIVNRIRLAFHVNNVAQEVAIASLADGEYMNQSIAHNLYWRQWLEKKLDQFGVHFQKTVTNFVFLPFENGSENHAKVLQDFLMDRMILTRALSLPKYPSCLRISIGTQGAMEALADGLKQFYASGKSAAIGK